MWNIGIMQGRLSIPKDDRIQFFPLDSWEKEFDLAARIGFTSIEWLFDFHDYDRNPIHNDADINKIKTLSNRYGVKVNSVCAHYFVEKPLIGSDDLSNQYNVLSGLMKRMSFLEAHHLVLPLENGPEIKDKIDLQPQISFLNRALKAADANNIEIDLETSLSVDNVMYLFEKIKNPRLKINYDCGNSIGIGNDINYEFNRYKEIIGRVHIKDKKRNGPTVQIGTGDVDFNLVRSCLKRINYSRDLILEVARGAPGEEFNWGEKNYSFVSRLFNNN